MTGDTALATSSVAPSPGVWLATLAQVDVTGGSPLVVGAAFVTFAVALVLSIAVTYRFVEGYRRTGTRPLLQLAVGMFLLTAAPMFLRLAMTNLGDVPDAVRVLAAGVSELLGLLTILYTIYER
jgi:hypothetical protein